MEYADLDEVLGYDADHSDETQYCRHGVWVGSWWGPDYLCQWCEMGASLEAMRYIQACQAVSGARKELKAAMAPYTTGKIVFNFFEYGKERGKVPVGERWAMVALVMDILWKEGRWESIKAARVQLSRALVERDRLAEMEGVLAEVEGLMT